MNKPILVVMAAGLGSRYGGLKQIAPVDDSGHILIDYSIFDAHKAGFDTVVCIIKPELLDEFKEVIGNRISKHLEVRYAFQLPDTLPSGFSMPQGRTKPWGTAHAVLSAKDVIDANFAVINADDYYGKTAFEEIYKFVANEADSSHHAMVGYSIENTLTEHGHVARGICKTDAQSRLVEIVERTHVEVRPGGAAYTEDGQNFNFLPDGTIVSMNMWGFNRSFLDDIESRFASFLTTNLPTNPLKCEYFLPLVCDQVLREQKAEIKVLSTPDKWYGVTYASDMPVVQEALAKFKNLGYYPKYLWEE